MADDWSLEEHIRDDGAVTITYDTYDSRHHNGRDYRFRISLSRSSSDDSVTCDYRADGRKVDDNGHLEDDWESVVIEKTEFHDIDEAKDWADKRREEFEFDAMFQQHILD